jgi:seryl-tRNA synthetase
MLDPNLIRNKPEWVRSMMEYRNAEPELVDEFLALDKDYRDLTRIIGNLKELRNIESREIARMKRDGADASQQIEAARNVSDLIKDLDDELRVTDEKRTEVLLWIPNMPHASVPLSKGRHL